MSPTDNTPLLNTGSFELVHSLKAYDKIPVFEYKSRNTGLTVVAAEIDGPIVYGYFCLATEAFDDDGIPHTLEHLVFLGSEDYPYKGVLDLLANRCLASGTNAWTDVDHTCYTMETAGSEGFLALMPIYLDHILYPVLSDEGFITEIHHVTEEGEDAGVVYCEMQGIENSGERRVHLAMRKAIYPENCGYSAETGGKMKNLRESITNAKIKAFHKNFYRPENLKIIIAGKIQHDDLFKALAPVEQKILSKGDRGPFLRPWQSSIPPLTESQKLFVKYPSDEEDNGIVAMAWRGPSAVNEIYKLNACSILLKYLTDSSVALLQNEFVEVDDPYASEVNFGIIENSISCIYLMFRNVPLEKIPLIRPKFDEIMQRIVLSKELDWKRIKLILKKQKLEYLSNLENCPHNSIVDMIIGHMLYGNTREDYEQRLNPLGDLEKMNLETPIFWCNLLEDYFVENHCVEIQALPSIEEKEKINVEEKELVMNRIKMMREDGLKRMGEDLLNAVKFNEREPPENMLTCVSIPNVHNFSFHEIERYTSDSDEDQPIFLKETPVCTYFDHIKSSFVYMYALMDTSKLSADQRLYLPLLLEAMFESPIMREGILIPYDEVVMQLQNDTVFYSQQMGLGQSKRFSCSSFSTTVSIMLQVAAENFEIGLNWLRELLYQTVFTAERLKIIAMKMINEVSEAKRSGRKIVSYAIKSLLYLQDSNVQANGILKQHKFLSHLISKLDLDNYQSSDILETIDTIRKMITDPCNVALYLATNLENIKPDSANVLNLLLPSDISKPEKKSFNIVPDWKLLTPDAEGGMRHCIVGMGCLDSSYLFQSTFSINTYDDPDMPALLVYIQYLCQAEGPMWRQVRGNGLSYGYSIGLRTNEGVLFLSFSRSTNVTDAYKKAYEIVTNQLKDQQWETNMFESAKSSLIFELVENESTVGNVISRSLESYFHKIEYSYYRKLIDLITQVTVEDLNRIGTKYVAALLDPTKVKTAVVCDARKVKEISEGFKNLSVPLEIFPTLEESFLNK
ncbi:uncharacterized protein C05D11.1 [Agrilus planipennis]|uniref:Uncharacterized protein C05D11.1 n=1 Tax=Agrilus planipennis TaxID=224129 RepID=A0A7F5R0U8_AGRPL|nr:uncharacterized protein C05D11.1 [Agrilus planipennis]